MPFVFHNPIALWALPLAAGPLLLHLWSRRRFHDEPWAAMDFLLIALASRARRMWLEQLLLLLLRTAAILLVVFAFADPRWRSVTPAVEPAAHRKAIHVLVLDASYSMQAQSESQSLWQTATGEARDVVQQAVAGDGFVGILARSRPEWFIEDVSYSQQAVTAAIDKLAPSDGAAEMAAAITEVSNKLRDLKARHRFDRVLVHVFSDLEQHSWESMLAGPSARALHDLSRQATLVLHDVTPPKSPNAFCVELAVEPPAPVVGESVSIAARIQSTHANPTSVTVRFSQSGQLLDQQSVRVGAHEDAIVQTRTRWEQVGDIPLEVRIEDDVLLVDNQRLCSVTVRQRIRVAIVEGVSGNGKWVSLALGGSETDGSPFETVTVSQSRLSTLDPQSYDVVVVLNPRPFSDAESAAAERLLRGGVGLILSFGDQVDPARWRTMAGKWAWLPAVPQQVVPFADYALSGGEYRHSALSIFRGNERAGLESVPVWRYCALQARAGDTIVTSNQGDSVLVAAQVHHARTVVTGLPLEALSMDRTRTPPSPWTALPIWPTFVPFVHSLARYAAGGSAVARTPSVGEPIEGTLPLKADISSAVLWMPTGRRQVLELHQDPPFWRWQAEGSWQRGWCRLELLPQGETRWLAINPDTTESHLHYVAPTSLPTTFVQDNQWQQELPAVRAPVPGVFRWLLLAALAALLLELFMNRMFAMQESSP